MGQTLSRSFLLGQVLTMLLIAQVGLVIWNVRVVKRPAARRWPDSTRLISVLVPARDEESTIAACLRSLMLQDHPNYEVIVLDDCSTDGTAAILDACTDPRVRVLTGAPLPPGWTGKNWACHQLAQQATGDLLCFVDADTILAPETLSRAAGVMQDDHLGLVSMLLRTETGTVAEAVLMPMVNYAMLAFVPAALMERPTSDQIAVALGPFIMVTREAYSDAGGHSREPGHIVDDVRLARAVKTAGHRVALRNGTALVQTRFYSGFGEIWDGFSKNAYGGLGYRPLVAFAGLFILIPALLFPFLRLGAGLWTGGALALAVAQVGLILISRTITSRVGRDPMWSVPLYPVMLTVWAGTLARSMVLARTQREIEWRGRKYVTRPSQTKR